MPAVTTPAAPAARAAHDARVEALAAAVRDAPAGQRVRLRKRTSNLFRARARGTPPRLDVSGFDGVLSVDPEARTADVQGMATYEQLVDATLPYGLMPLVVPQLKTITLGGAVTGLGIESSSFRNGLPHESVLEMEILTGDGRVVHRARRTTSTRTSSPPSPTPTARSATPCAWRSSWSRSSRSSRCGTCASASPVALFAECRGLRVRAGTWTGARGRLRRRHGVLPATSCT